MTSQEVLREPDEASQGRSLPSTLDYPTEVSHWSQNHGPILFAITAFTLIVGYGVIFFSSTELKDYTKPLVPNNFVPDEEASQPADPASDESTNEEAETNTNPAAVEEVEAD